MAIQIDEGGLSATLRTATERLLAARGRGGHWEGKLSSSALSTATAAFAMSLADRERHAGAIALALAWLADNQNSDGGWGDTTRSRSNISTTLLGWSALALPEAAGGELAAAAGRAQRWVERHAGGLDADHIASAVNAAYGEDRTFSAPILTMCALAGRLGPTKEAWRHVKALPFELGMLGHRKLRRLRVPVVSYALPALIAIGQVRHQFRRPLSPLARLVRGWARRPTLARLEQIQPTGGGFLEAAPLTSFVAMSLAAMGMKDNAVLTRGLGFLRGGQRADGSWPIDTNLATWTTSLSVAALAADGGGARFDRAGEAEHILDWLCGQQHRREHPYTGAAPGGWAWTDLPGGVPDADDTAGALVALRILGAPFSEELSQGVRWLLDLQNGDGGIPTFCRGWGRLPFDRSAPDLTAHALSAWGVWREKMPAGLSAEVERAARRAIRYLAASQSADGSWSPLWFGNEHAPGSENRVYGTSRVLDALCGLRAEQRGAASRMCGRAAAWLAGARNADGGWGGDGAASGVEETALATGALAHAAVERVPPEEQRREVERAVEKGAAWLIFRTQCGAKTESSPIGLYFARLWYYEELYPLLFTAWAAGRVRRLLLEA